MVGGLEPPLEYLLATRGRTGSPSPLADGASDLADGQNNAGCSSARRKGRLPQHSVPKKEAPEGRFPWPMEVEASGRYRHH